MRKTYCSAVIAAAGRSERMGEDKMFLQLLGVPVLARTLLAFQNCGVIDEIVLVTRRDSAARAEALCGEFDINKLTAIIPGGEKREDSVYAGVYAASKKAHLIAVHDGARPLVTDKIIRAAVETAKTKYAAVPAVNVKATIKRVKNGVVTQTPAREALYEAQTPQVFDADLLKAALERFRENTTDEASAVEALGAAVYITAGGYENIKITTPEDILFAEAIIRAGETL